MTDEMKPDVAPNPRRNLIKALTTGAAAALITREAMAQPGPSPGAGGGGGGGVSLGFSSTTALAGNLGGIDDPANTSGLGAPAIIRGTVYGHLAAGLTIGTGLSQTVQALNATALQNAINYAVANNKFFELIPNTYQIYSSTGLTIGPANGFVWRGSMYETIIQQFYATGQGAPILTLGDPLFATSSNGWDFHGVLCEYGVSQSSLTNAQAVIIGCQTLSKIGGINIYGGAYQPYNGLVFNGGATLGNFSNIFDNIIIVQVQNSFVILENAVGTGNVVDNLYMNNGPTGNTNAISGYYINAGSSSLPTDWEFRRVNCEWGVCAALINITNALGFHFGQLHIEGITLGSVGVTYNPKFFATTDVSLQIDCLDIVDVYIQTTYGSGTAALVQDYTGGASVIKINTLTWYNNSSSNITLPFQFYVPAGGGAPDDSLVFNIDNGYMRDAGGTNFGNYVAFDDNMPTANFHTPQKFGRYSYGIGGSKVEYAQIPVSSTYTHYGQHYWATILVPASITSFTLTLADTVGANGSRPTPYGNVVRVHRTSGTASGTLTIKDGGGTTLATNTTSATDYYYYFNGTAYASFTPEATS